MYKKLIFLIAFFIFPTSGIVTGSVLTIPPLRIHGADLACIQAKNGLPIKTIEYMKRKSKSNPDLNDKVKKLEEVDLSNGYSSSYMETFVQQLLPIANLIEKETGIPAVISISQAALESGWGGSNPTVLNNNILGISTGGRSGSFEINLSLGDETIKLEVNRKTGERYFHFDYTDDCIYYYTYLLLQNIRNEQHYRRLRKYISENSFDSDSPEHKRKVLSYISEGYHPSPTLYTSRVQGVMNEVKPIIRKISDRGN